MNKELKGEIIKRYGSQFAFAHAIGWHEASISRVIRGHHVLDVDIKRRWAEVLGVSVEILFPEVTDNGQ